MTDSFATSGGANNKKIKAHFIYKCLMKYNSKTKMLEFSSDESVFKFHDQLTEIMRFAMSSVGGDETSEDEALKLTHEFFAQYSALSEALKCMRAHLPRGELR